MVQIALVVFIESGDPVDPSGSENMEDLREI